MTQINHQWRITKYNPDFRDEDGYYTLVKEWTCPSEIGKTINGNKFTIEEYLRVEAAYVETVIQFLIDSKRNTLRILRLNKVDISQEDKCSALYELGFEDVKLEEDAVVTIKEIRTISKMILRNFLSCEFYSKDEFFVHFGWDYYMFIGTCDNSLSAIDFAKRSGLFVEPFTSPYNLSEEDTIRSVEWNEIAADSKIIVGGEELNAVPLDEYRRVFNLSEEHPVIGQFDITVERKDFFQRLLKHKMDFTTYDYFFIGES